MKRSVILILLLMSFSVMSAPKYKVNSCISDGGVWIDKTCFYPTVYDECTPETQFTDCEGGTTSATGPGICVIGESGYYVCDYLYQQSCTTDADCASYLGLEESAYVCCQTGSTSSCLNPLLCR